MYYINERGIYYTEKVVHKPSVYVVDNLSTEANAQLHRLLNKVRQEGIREGEQNIKKKLQDITALFV